MFVSIAAVALGKYEWFRFHGKRTTKVKAYHRSLELALEPKDKFGIRKYGTKYKMVDLSDPKSVFTLEEEEAKRILRRSKGFRGTYKGIRLAAGKGGLDSAYKAKAPKSKPSAKPRVTRRVHTPEGDEPVRDPKYFPDLPMPPKKADVQRLYNYFNKLHFNGECPTKLRILFSEALKFSGQAQTRSKDGHIQFTLKLSKNAITDRIRIINVVLHEMIHLLHHKRAYVDGDLSYVDAGHGPLFTQEMHRLNKFGYNIDVREKDIKEVELADPVYALLIRLQDGKTIILHHKNGFQKKIPEILDAIRAKVVASITPVHYTYGKTSSSYSYLGMKLTSKQTLQKGRRIRVFDRDKGVAQSVLRQMDVISEESLKRELGDVRGSVESSVSASVGYLAERFSVYMAVVLQQAGLHTGLNLRRIMDAAHTILTQDEYAFIEKSWLDAEDRHLLQTDEFKHLRKDFLKHGFDGVQAIRILIGFYDKQVQTGEYENRVSLDRFADLAVEAIGDIITIPDGELRSRIVNKVIQ